MGESYLQRKLFNRLKKTPRNQLQNRSETLSSICSQTSSNKRIIITSPTILKTRTADQCAEQQTQVAPTTSSPMPSSSTAPLPLNMMIRQEMPTSRTIPSPFSSSSNDLNDEEPQIEVCNQSDDYDEDDDDDQEELDNNNNNNEEITSKKKSKIELTKSQSLPKICRQMTTPEAVSSATTANHPAKRSRLKSVTKAILFFRKSKSSFGSTRSTRSSSISNRSSSNQLNRQSTNDSSWSQNALSAPNFHQTNNQSQQQQQQHQKNSSSVIDIPQFLVPKVNTLRLPLVCLIKSLNGELMREVFVHRYELGEYLMENLKISFGLNDCKYFGLKFAKSFDDQEDLRNNWLDLNESVCKQIKNNKSNLIQVQGNNSSQSNSTNPANPVKSVDFYLRIKFYPPNLTRVQDSFLRNYLWLQLRRDLRLGKLTSSMNNLTLLMACVLQYEFGDYAQYKSNNIDSRLTRPPSSAGTSSLEQNHNQFEENSASIIGGRNHPLEQQIADLNILPNQDLIEERAIELWRTKLNGMRQYQAQMQFLRAAVILETYGFDYYPVRDHQRQRAYLLGFNYAGVKTIKNGRIVHHFRWHNMSKISYERRMIIFHIYPNENSKRKQILGFKCLSNEDCQNLYMRLLEQKYFFTVDLAYFDKSVRRPSYLCESQSDSLFDWSSLATPASNGRTSNGNISNGNHNNSTAAVAAATTLTTISPQVDHSNSPFNVQPVKPSNESPYDSGFIGEHQEQEHEQKQQQQQQQQQQRQHSELTQQSNVGRLRGGVERQRAVPETNKQSSFAYPYSYSSSSSSLLLSNDNNDSTLQNNTKILGTEQASSSSPSQHRCSAGKKVAVAAVADSESSSLSRYADSICTQCCSSGKQTDTFVSNYNYQSQELFNNQCNVSTAARLPESSKRVSQASLAQTRTAHILQRQQSTMQYESSMSSFPPPPPPSPPPPPPTFASSSDTTNLEASQNNSNQLSGGTWKLSGVWSRVSSLGAATNNNANNEHHNHNHQHRKQQQKSNSSTSYQFVHRLIEFAESVLIEPIASIQFRQHTYSVRRNQEQDEGEREREGDGGENRGTSNRINFSSRLLLPAIRLCLLILIMNMMLRVSENLSNVLIELFTFGAYQNNPTSHAISHHSDF